MLSPSEDFLEGDNSEKIEPKSSAPKVHKGNIPLIFHLRAILVQVCCPQVDKEIENVDGNKGKVEQVVGRPALVSVAE